MIIHMELTLNKRGINVDNNIIDEKFTEALLDEFSYVLQLRENTLKCQFLKFVFRIFNHICLFTRSLHL